MALLGMVWCALLLTDWNMLRLIAAATCLHQRARLRAYVAVLKGKY